jgi:hypothetical protein
LVPLDGSKLSECSLVHIKNIVQGDPGPEVILINVHEPIMPMAVIVSETLAKERRETNEKNGKRDLAKN